MIWKEPPLQVGDTLYGQCKGAFGLDATGDKKVEAIGRDWVVARELTRGVLQDVPMLYWGDPNFLLKFRTCPSARRIGTNHE